MFSLDLSSNFEIEGKIAISEFWLISLANKNSILLTIKSLPDMLSRDS